MVEDRASTVLSGDEPCAIHLRSALIRGVGSLTRRTPNAHPHLWQTEHSPPPLPQRLFVIVLKTRSKVVEVLKVVKALFPP